VGWRWRKKTVRGFGRTNAAGAAANLLAVVAIREWWAARCGWP
jgi:hypothetical protein